MVFKYFNLKKRINDRVIAYEDIAKKMSISTTKLRDKLSGKSEFKIEEIDILCKILDISAEKISIYFFTT